MNWFQIFIGFICGLAFYHYVLDREEVKNIFNARVKQKGHGNIMTFRKGQISGDMKRREVLRIWKSLQKDVI